MTAPKVRVGDRIPRTAFRIMTEDGPKPIGSDEFFAGRRIAVFAVPGAFTPTCSARHLPGFVEQAGALKAKGVDLIACIATNDVFVMSAWAKASNVGESVLMLSDGNGEFAEAMGLEIDASANGMGKRSKRYSMVVNDGVIESLHVEEPGKFEVSSADYMLAHI